MRRIYIAGPLSKGDLGVNIAAAIRAANKVVRLGAAPYVPHLTVYWHFLNAAAGEPTRLCDHDHWLRLDFAWLRACDALLRLPGESVGADLEEAEASRCGIPVFRSLEGLRAWLQSQE